MADSIIVCPNCKHNIPLTAAIEGPIRERMAAEVSRRVNEECDRIKAETQKSLGDEFLRKEKQAALQIEALRQELAAGQRRAEVLAAKEQALAAEKLKLEELRLSVDAQVSAKLNAERQKLAAQALAQASEAKAMELKSLESRLAEKDQKLQEAQRLEIQVREQAVKLQEQAREMELQAARTLDAERAKIREAALKAADETHRLKEREAEEKMAAMRRQIDELRQRAEQGSQQLQGEVLELELEETLRAAYPHDEIVPVAKGIHGGDVLQRIMTPSRQLCGTILWETKRTKTWSDVWIDKLKVDQRAAKADIAVIVSIALPKDCTTMKEINGVWVSSRECMMGMVMALRSGLIRLAEIRRAAQGQHQKMEILYQYVSGHEFKQRVEAIIEAFSALRKDLEDEKAAMKRIWGKREKQIERVLDSTTGMHGDLAGIIGAALPVIEAIDLPALAEARTIE